MATDAVQSSTTPLQSSSIALHVGSATGHSAGFVAHVAAPHAWPSWSPEQTNVLAAKQCVWR